MGLMIFSPTGQLELSYGTPAPLPAPAPQPLPLPPLIDVDCWKCQGIGYLEHFDPMLAQRCDSCFGSKWIQVCSGCGEVPGVVSGLDCCGCGVAILD